MLPCKLRLRHRSHGNHRRHAVVCTPWLSVLQCGSVSKTVRPIMENDIHTTDSLTPQAYFISAIANGTVLLLFICFDHAASRLTLDRSRHTAPVSPDGRAISLLSAARRLLIAARFQPIIYYVRIAGRLSAQFSLPISSFVCRKYARWLSRQNRLSSE